MTVIFNLHLDGYYILFLSETNGICTPLLNTQCSFSNEKILIYHELYHCDPKIIPQIESALTALYFHLNTHIYISKNTNK